MTIRLGLNRKGTALLDGLFSCNSRAKWKLLERFLGKATAQDSLHREKKKNFQRTFIETYLRSANLESFRRDDFCVLRKPLRKYPKMAEYRQMNQIDIVKSEVEKLTDMIDLMIAKQKGYVELPRWENPKALFFDDELKEYGDEIPWLRDEYFTVNHPAEAESKPPQPPKQQEVVLVPIQQQQQQGGADAKPAKKHDKHKTVFSFSTLRSKFKSSKSGSKDNVVISAPVLSGSSTPDPCTTPSPAVDPRLVAALSEERTSPSPERRLHSRKTPSTDDQDAPIRRSLVFKGRVFNLTTEQSSKPLPAPPKKSASLPPSETLLGTSRCAGECTLYVSGLSERSDDAELAEHPSGASVEGASPTASEAHTSKAAQRSEATDEGSLSATQSVASENSHRKEKAAPPPPPSGAKPRLKTSTLNTLRRSNDSNGTGKEAAGHVKRRSDLKIEGTACALADPEPGDNAWSASNGRATPTNATPKIGTAREGSQRSDGSASASGTPKKCPPALPQGPKPKLRVPTKLSGSRSADILPTPTNSASAEPPSQPTPHDAKHAVSDEESALPESRKDAERSAEGGGGCDAEAEPASEEEGGLGSAEDDGDIVKYKLLPSGAELAPLIAVSDNFKTHEHDASSEFGALKVDAVPDKVYHKHFECEPHRNLWAADAEGNTVIVSYAFADAKCGSLYVLIRSLTYTKVSTVKLHTKSIDIFASNIQKAVFDFLEKERIAKPQILEYSQELISELAKLEELEQGYKHKVGVIYARAGQTTEQDMLGNGEDTVSEHFKTFMKLIGKRVNLTTWEGYAGGLDTAGLCGKRSYYTEFGEALIMFHVAPLIPSKASDTTFISRKRYIGNDVTVIVFKEGDDQIKLPLLKSNFVHQYIVVSPVASADGEFLGVACDVASVCDQSYGPRLPSRSRFIPKASVREFVLCKLLNGETATKDLPTFAQMRASAKKVLMERLPQLSQSK